MTPLEQQVREALTGARDNARREHQASVGALVSDEQLAFILTALRPLLEQQAAEVTDWILVADSVKHDWRCKNNEASGGVKGGNFICLRCQVATLTAEREATSLASIYGTRSDCSQLLRERDEAREIAKSLFGAASYPKGHSTYNCPACTHGSKIAAWSGETR